MTSLNGAKLEALSVTLVTLLARYIWGSSTPYRSQNARSWSLQLALLLHRCEGWEHLASKNQHSWFWA